VISGIVVISKGGFKTNGKALPPGVALAAMLFRKDI
jgi:hypothetical protein